MENQAWYLPRSRGGITSATAAWLTASSAPPPIPCKARATISISTEEDSAHTTEATQKNTSAGISTSRRPNWSDSLP